MNNFQSFIDSIDLQAMTDSDNERFDIEQLVRSVFGDEVEVIEFEPYDTEGNTTSRRAN